MTIRLHQHKQSQTFSAFRFDYCEFLFCVYFYSFSIFMFICGCLLCCLIHTPYSSVVLISCFLFCFVFMISFHMRVSVDFLYLCVFCSIKIIYPALIFCTTLVCSLLIIVLLSPHQILVHLDVYLCAHLYSSNSLILKSFPVF